MHWRTYLERSLEASGQSMRQVSMKSGHADDYLRNILKRGKTPSVDAYADVCRVLNVPPLLADELEKLQ